MRGNKGILTMRLIAGTATLAAVAVLGVTWYVGRPSADQGQCSASSVEADIGGPLELVNQSGVTVTEKEIFTEPSIVYFGYTFCPDVCPFDVARNADAVDLLAEKGISVSPVFITIDPERDTVEVMADYAENMHDKLIALTGSAEQIDAASKAYKTYYKKQDNGTDEYFLDHSSFSYLVFPKTGFAEFFRRDVSAEQMAERVGCFVENA